MISTTLDTAKQCGDGGSLNAVTTLAGSEHAICGVQILLPLQIKRLVIAGHSRPGHLFRTSPVPWSKLNLEKYLFGAETCTLKVDKDTLYCE